MSLSHRCKITGCKLALAFHLMTRATLPKTTNRIKLHPSRQTIHLLSPLSSVFIPNHRPLQPMSFLRTPCKNAWGIFLPPSLLFQMMSIANSSRLQWSIPRAVSHNLQIIQSVASVIQIWFTMKARNLFFRSALRCCKDLVLYSSPRVISHLMLLKALQRTHS